MLAEWGYKFTGDFKYWLGCDQATLFDHVIQDALKRGIDITDSKNSSDHIIPVKCAQKIRGESIDVRKIFIITNYRNLRMMPLPANLLKSGSCTWEEGQDHLKKMTAAGYDDTDDANGVRQGFFAKNTAPCTDGMKARALRNQTWDMKRG